MMAMGATMSSSPPRSAPRRTDIIVEKKTAAAQPNGMELGEKRRPGKNEGDWLLW